MAGTETVASSLLWAIVYFTRDPSIHARVRQETRDNIGGDIMPSYCQLNKLPFTEATIYEILRLADVAPHGIIHSTSSDTQFHGYDIAKDTIVITNLHSVLYDETLWGDPEAFRPSRFLDENGQIMRAKTDKVIAFSMGK